MATGCGKDDAKCPNQPSEVSNHTKIIVFPEKKTITPGKSFFQLYPEEEKRQEQQIAEKKVLPSSQPTLTDSENLQCNLCGRIFLSKGGRTRHRKHCKKKNEAATTLTETFATENVTSETSIGN